MNRLDDSTAPSFQDYRTTNDAVMVADIGFKKHLWALDPELDVVWDWKSERWEIWRFPGQEKKVQKNINEPRAHYVMKIDTKKRFRELGADILLKLQENNSRGFDLKQLVAYFDKMDDNIRRAKEKAMREKFRAIGHEIEWFFKGLRVQMPKNLPIFKKKNSDVIGGLVHG